MYKCFVHVFISVLIFFSACNNNRNKSFYTVKDTSLTYKESSVNQISILDTTVKLVGIKKSKYNNVELNDSIAKKTLYDHFMKRGFWTADNLPNVSNIQTGHEKKLCVEFASIYKVDLNNNNSSDAVITYWLTPPHAVGNSWQPHKAIIMDTDTGYTISNEEFIPCNYAIDSLIIVNKQIIICGYKYEFDENKISKTLRIRLSK